MTENLTTTTTNTKKRILVLEPFYGGSHKQFLDTLFLLNNTFDDDDTYDGSCSNKVQSEHSSVILKSEPEIQFEFTLCEMRAKKWHWRARTSALYFANIAPCGENFDVLLVSSVLPLAELCGLRVDLANIGNKIIYFHENQLVYPIQEIKERDFQYGFNQILSCLVADQLVFNSAFNRDSFLTNIRPFLKIMPDYRPPNMDQFIQSISNKSQVLYYPIHFTNIPLHMDTREKSILHIVWPHRWEHDKNPESFFQIMFQLKEENVPFKLSVLGESFSKVPDIFEEAKIRLSTEIVHWGYLSSKDEFYKVLSTANVAISTAVHEFFGVSMLEAAYSGCFPLCPARLSYVELFNDKYLYRNENECIEKLKQLSLSPDTISKPLDLPYSKVDWTNIRDCYINLFTSSPKQK